MASVNWLKIKTSRKVSGVLRHCDTEKRLTDKHSNTDIDKNITSQNRDLIGGGYELAYLNYKEHLDYLDSQPDSNKRKDRVVCFCLETAVPAGLPEDQEDRWCDRTLEEVEKVLGKDNVFGAWEHKDEKHTYRDHDDTLKMSRTHLHILCVPDVDGRLNGRKFSSLKNINKVNQAIHDMSEREFGVKFMDGTKKKGKKSVEELKLESMKKQVEKNLAETAKLREAAAFALNNVINTITDVKKEISTILDYPYADRSDIEYMRLSLKKSQEKLDEIRDGLAPKTFLESQGEKTQEEEDLIF